jgi:hypothetical protein
MDPITAINLEFVRELRADWSRQAPTQEAQTTLRAARRSVTARGNVG